jgi:hypothetical protein
MRFGLTDQVHRLSDAPRSRDILREKTPGRLYDVPVALGWLPTPLSEAQLNPLDFAM